MNRKQLNREGERNIQKRPLSLLLLLLILPTLACQFGQQAGTATNTEAENGQSAIATTIAELSPFAEKESTAQPSLGESRANPLPPGTDIKKGNWSVEILETNRGETAWQAIHRVNSNNQLPPEGWEYFNVKMRIKNNELSTDKSSLYFYITGDNRIQYAFYQSGVVSPEPQLENYIPGRTESEGWESFLIQENEHNLMFVFEDIETYEDPPTYLAIEEGANIPIDDDMIQSITRTEFGTSQAQPVPYGQTATGEDWQIIVKDVLRGESAWNEIFEENQFNDPPESDMEYIMVKLHVRYIGFDEHGEHISDRPFTLHTNTGTEFDVPSLVDPEPTLNYTLYPGGEAEGWIVLTAPADTKDPTLFFSPDASGANNRYLSLGQGR